MTTINGIPLSNNAMSVLHDWNLGGEDARPAHFVEIIGEIQDFLTEIELTNGDRDPVLLGHLASLIAIKRDFQRMVTPDQAKKGGNQ